MQSAAAKNWEEACRKWPANAAAAYDHCTADPRRHTSRHHQLHGSLATASYKGRTLERWQHELTSSARVIFLIDDDEHTVRFEEVAMGHPKRTEKRR